MNRIKNFLRSCYTNEVKSAKELRISMRGEHCKFYPNVAYSHIEGEEEKLDFRTKRPVNINNTGHLPNPLSTVDDGPQTLYDNDLDKWMLTN